MSTMFTRMLEANTTLDALDPGSELRCSPGMWLPLLGELDANSDPGEIFGGQTLSWPRGLLMPLYLIGMLWMFLGVGIVADMFMAGIETVTSVTKTIKGPDGSEFEVKVS